MQKLGRSVDFHPCCTESLSLSSFEAPRVGCLQKKEKLPLSDLSSVMPEKREQRRRRRRQTRASGGSRLRKIQGCDVERKRMPEGRKRRGCQSHGKPAKSGGCAELIWLDVLDEASIGREEMKLESSSNIEFCRFTSR